MIHFGSRRAKTPSEGREIGNPAVGPSVECPQLLDDFGLILRQRFRGLKLGSVGMRCRESRAQLAQRHDKRRVGAIGTAALLALQFRQKLRLLVQFLRESLDLRLKALGRIDRGLRACRRREGTDALLDGREAIAERLRLLCRLLCLSRIGCGRRALLQLTHALIEGSNALLGLGRVSELHLECADSRVERRIG